jgi:hypothetical protein
MTTAKLKLSTVAILVTEDDDTKDRPAGTSSNNLSEAFDHVSSRSVI